MASGAFSSIQSLSTKLIEALRGTTSTSHQQDPPCSVREDLEKLSRMLARIQAVQQDAEEREIHDCSVRLWLEELRGVGYQAEDVLDEFYYEVLRSIVESGDAAIEAYHRDGGNKSKVVEKYPSSALASPSSFITKISIPSGMAEKIKCITERFEEISNDRRALQLREEDGTRLVIGPQIRPPTSSHVDETSIFGREEEKETIISHLNLSNDPFMVLPIVGMGGFGKTTLAQLVYNDSRIRLLFNKRSWISVSEDFDLVRLTKAIVESLSNIPCEFSELSILQDVLKENIRGLSLFLVLDDVWNENGNLWECFRVGFSGAKFVRILTTTRNTSVAKIMQTASPFQLGSLPEENCWSLFKHSSFGNRGMSENANLNEIGRGIVQKCKGSPLAIKALGGILRHEMDEEKWREILESEISKIDETGEIMPALRLSYQKLPRHLKPCFLYLSMFPKDTSFEKNSVVRLWMAQGYINGNTRNLKTLEEIGSQYFDELEGRSLVNHGPFTEYLLHDLIHDLARSISQEACRPVSVNDLKCSGPCKVYHLYLTKQDKLLGSFLAPRNYCSIRTVVNRCPTENFSFEIFSEMGSVRALMLSNSLLPNTLDTLKHLRYLSVENSQMKTLPESLCLLYNLQTLDLHGNLLQELPENIKNLVNLRYFKLTSGLIEQLPETIFRLCNLNTLSLRLCAGVKELPRGIEQLTRLCILDLPPLLIYMPPGIGKLTTLKPLSGNFNVMDHGISGGLGELKDMNMLSGWLCISGLRNISDVVYSRNANLVSKPNLHKLILNFKEDGHRLKRRDNGPCLKLNVCSSKNAKNENDEKMQDVVLESLQPHGNLTELEISNHRGRVFPSWLLNPLLPKLTTLTLSFCIEPNFLPPLGQLPYLKVLEISGSMFRPRNIVRDENTYSFLAEYGSSTQPKKPSYPSLEVLSLQDMRNLVEWQGGDGDFPSLKQLTIKSCPKLWKIPVIPQEVRKVTFKHCPKLDLLTCPSIIENLMIHKCGFREIIFGLISESLTISNCVELISINWGNKGFISVKEVSFEYCPKLELITIPVGTLKLKIHECGFREIMFMSVYENLTISNCGELISINWMDRSLNFVREVSFEHCPNLKLVNIPVGTMKLKIHECGFHEFMFQSVSENLTISNCAKLMSINCRNGGLSSVEDVTFGCCPNLKLQCDVMDVLHSMTRRADIYNSHRLYCGKRFIYQRDTTIKELSLSGNNEICLSDSTITLLEYPFLLFLTKEDFGELQSLRYAPVVFRDQRIMLNLASLVILEILKCRKVISVTGLDNLSNLKRLSISCCPELRNWNDKTLPLSLEFLKLDSCDKLSSLPLLSVQNHSSILKVLVIMKCPMLAELKGFHGLLKLITVELLHCRSICISPATEILQFNPHFFIGQCPLMRNWCQRNNITYYELLTTPKMTEELNSMVWKIGQVEVDSAECRSEPFPISPKFHARAISPPKIADFLSAPSKF